MVMRQGSKPGVGARSASGPEQEGPGQECRPKVWILGALILAAGCASQGGGQPAVSPPDSPPSAVRPSAAPSAPVTESQPAAPACPLCVDPSAPESSRREANERVLAAYAAAIEDAKYPAPEKISRDLTPLLRSTGGLIWDEAGRILMATWTQAKYYDDPETYRRGQPFSLYGDTWLTAVPFVRDFCAAVGLDDPMLTQRLEQLLGLPPAAGKDAFLEVWVDPTDVFRPCPDPEITDHQCQVEIPVVNRDAEKPWDCTLKRQVSGKYVTVHPGHLQWMCYNWTLSYASDDPLKNYPWTALGYTYDWGNPEDPRGLSEYVVPGGSQVVFESLSSTGLYCSSSSEG